MQLEPLVVTLYFPQLPQQVVVAAGQDHQLKTVRLAGQAVVVLRIPVRAVQLLQQVKVLQGVLTQPLEIKLLAVVEHPQLELTAAQVVVTAVLVLQTVFLVPLSLMAVGVAVVVALLKHPLEQVELVVVVQGQVVPPYLQRGL